MRRKELLSSLLGSLVLLSLLISLFSGGLVCYASTGEAELAGATRLTIIHTNDTHARVREGDGMGFARISAIVREIKRKIRMSCCWTPGTPSRAGDCQPE